MKHPACRQAHGESYYLARRSNIVTFKESQDPGWKILRVDLVLTQLPMWGTAGYLGKVDYPAKTTVGQQTTVGQRWLNEMLIKPQSPLTCPASAASCLGKNHKNCWATPPFRSYTSGLSSLIGVTQNKFEWWPWLTRFSEMNYIRFSSIKFVFEFFTPIIYTIKQAFLPLSPPRLKGIVVAVAGGVRNILNAITLHRLPVSCNFTWMLYT